MLGGEEHFNVYQSWRSSSGMLFSTPSQGYILHKDNTCLQEININEREWIKAQYLQESTTYISYSPVVPILLA